MKICGACGLELDSTCFSNKQWQLSKQKRRCKECVDKSTSPAGGAEAGHGGADGDLNEEPRPPPPVESLENDFAGTVASSEGQTVEPRSPLPVQIADDVGCTDTSSEGGTGGEGICSICLDVFDNPVKLSCGHSFCEVCLDGWHKKSKFDVHQPRNCPMCRHRAKPSKEIISKLYALSCVVSNNPKVGDEGYDEIKMEQDDLMSSLLKMGHTVDEIVDMVKEHTDSQNQIPQKVSVAAIDNDDQTILDWLGSPVDEDKLTSVRMGATILHMTVCGKNKELTSFLLQHGADVDAFDCQGSTAILHALKKSGGLLNEIVTLLYEWGASLKHHLPGKKGALTDIIFGTTPMFKNELVKRRCEIINLNQRKDLIGQTCIVEKFTGQEESV